MLALESGIRYHAYYWEPSLGIKVDLGSVERPSPGNKILEDNFEDPKNSPWEDLGTKTVRGAGRMSGSGDMLTVLKAESETDFVAPVDARSDADAGLVLRYHEAEDYLVAGYSPKEHGIYILDRKKGADGPSLGKTPVPTIGPDIRLTAEVRGRWAIVSITDGMSTYTTPIVEVSNTSSGRIGLKHGSDGATQVFGKFILRHSPTVATDIHLERKLYDARGNYRGEISGPSVEGSLGKLWNWDEFAKEKVILLDAYRPLQFPTTQDWVLVLEHLK